MHTHLNVEKNNTFTLKTRLPAVIHVLFFGNQQLFGEFESVDLKTSKILLNKTINNLRDMLGFKLIRLLNLWKNTKGQLVVMNKWEL